MAEPIRLQKFFTDCGVLSRRAAEAEILAGKVRVNGRVAVLGDRVDPEVDQVEYEGKLLRPRRTKPYLYLMLNKPRGYVSTAKDEKGRRSVIDLTRNAGSRVYPVGRLDMDSDGLLLLTDDGAFANHLTHPRHEIPKIYRVTLTREPTEEQLTVLASPMELDGYRLQPVGIRPLSSTELEMTLYEGRNRQIRRMCEAVGLKITRLQRVAIGELTLGSLPTGAWRHLTPAEVAYLFPQSNNDNKTTEN